MEACEITIRNWKKYQAEGLKHESTRWYRQQNDTWLHELWDVLSGDEFKAKTFIDCMVSQQSHKTGTLVLFIAKASRLSGLPKEVVVSAIQKLSSNRVGYLDFKESPLNQDQGQVGSHSEADYERSGSGLQAEFEPSVEGSKGLLRDEHNERTNKGDSTESPVGSSTFDFETAYRRFPKKKGKDEGMRKCKADIKTPEDFAAWETAMYRYADFFGRPLKLGEFREAPQHFSVFMSKGTWRDLQDPDWGNDTEKTATANQKRAFQHFSGIEE